MRDHGSPRLGEGIGKRQWVSKTRWGIGERLWVSEATCGDRNSWFSRDVIKNSKIQNPKTPEALSFTGY